MKNVDFIIIGAMKAGTTSLASYLNESKEIYIPPEKELPFFTHKNLQKGGFETFMKKYFKSASSGQLLGTSTPQYMMNPDSFEMIKEILPNVKLIAILRNPIDRLISHYDHACRLGVENRTLNDVITKQLKENNHNKFMDNTTNKYISAGEYGYILGEVLKYFHNSQVLLIDFDDLVKDTQNTVDKASDFIGIQRFPYKKEYRVKMRGGSDKIININHDRFINLSAYLIKFFRLKSMVPGFIKRFVLNAGSFIDMINVSKDSKSSRVDIDPVLLNKLDSHYANDRSDLKKHDF
jgi:hypothetical protein